MGNSRVTPGDLWQLRLRDLPRPVKMLFTGALLTLGVGYLAAVAHIGLAVGVVPAQVVEHYWGNEATRLALEEEAAAAVEEETISEEMSFDEFEEDVASAQPLVAIPSFKSLIGEAHFHSFGFTMIFFICGFIISFAALGHSLKAGLILIPFIASICDVLSTFLIRFVHPGFSALMYVAGGVMGLSFVIIFVVALSQMWFGRARGAGVAG